MGAVSIGRQSCKTYEKMYVLLDVFQKVELESLRGPAKTPYV